MSSEEARQIVADGLERRKEEQRQRDAELERSVSCESRSTRIIRFRPTPKPRRRSWRRRRPDSAERQTRRPARTEPPEIWLRRCA